MKILPAISVIVCASASITIVAVDAIDTEHDESSKEQSSDTSSEVVCLDSTISTSTGTTTSAEAAARTTLTSSANIIEEPTQHQRSIHTNTVKLLSLQQHQQRGFSYGWPHEYVLRLFQYFLRDSSPSLSNTKTRNRFIKIKGHDSIVAPLCHRDSKIDDSTQCSMITVQEEEDDDAYYELLEPLHLIWVGKYSNMWKITRTVQW